jgi:hypothetical protein
VTGIMFNIFYVKMSGLSVLSGKLPETEKRY